MGDEARALSLLLGVVFALAALSKVQILRSSEAYTHPLLARPALVRRHATSLIATALLLELATTASLLLAPQAGLLVAAALLLAYLWAIVFLAPPEGCACFGNLLPRLSRAAAVVRNTALAALSIGAWALLGDGSAPAAVSARSGAEMAAVLAGVVGWLMSTRVPAMGQRIRQGGRA